MNIRPCVECAHFDNSGHPTYLQGQQGAQPKEPRCKHPEATTRDLVDGIAYCRNERHTKGKRGCGKEGRLWTSRSTA